MAMIAPAPKPAVLSVSTTAEPLKIVPNASGAMATGEMLPVYEVFADSMSPAHISPFGAVRVVLVEKVVFAIIVYHSIGVVHPTVKR